ncbi:MAG: extracellular solute-binding protein [Actinophytocola sp.]|uniref:extracellular solute-binding protein n=1 Tax=Actinophytocola sp. TaxID=1872138 RepID=UPI003D6C2A7F
MPDSRGDEVVVTVWLADHPFFPGFLDPLKEAADSFNATHPGRRIVVEGHDFRKLPADVADAVARGNPPDVAEYYTSATQLALDTIAEDGEPLFTSVERAVAGRSEILGEPVRLAEILPTARDTYVVDGELRSAPVTITTPLLYTNLTLLRRTGITEPPCTWAELETACRALAELGSGHERGPERGAVWPVHGWLFQQAVAEQGGLLADHDNGRTGRPRRVDLCSPELLAYVEWWRRLHRAGHYLYTGAQADWAGAFDAFVSGRVAFTVASSVQTGMIVAAGREAGFEVGASRLPHNGEVPYAGNVVSGQSLWLARGLDESTQDTALAFLSHLLAPDTAAAWHRGTGFVPATGAAYDLLAGEGWFDATPQLAAATGQLAASDRSPAALGPVLGDLAAIQDLLTQAMADVLERDADPAERFAAANAEGQRLLDDYNAHCHGPRRRTPPRLDVG